MSWDQIFSLPQSLRPNVNPLRKRSCSTWTREETSWKRPTTTVLPSVHTKTIPSSSSPHHLPRIQYHSPRPCHCPTLPMPLPHGNRAQQVLELQSKPIMLSGHLVINSLRSVVQIGWNSGTRTLLRLHLSSSLSKASLGWMSLPNHLLFHLTDACWPVSTTGMESIPSVLSHTPISILISIPRGEQGRGRSISTPDTMRIWDTQEGVIINDIDINDIGEVVFSGLQGTITLIVEGDYHTYDLPTGTQLCNGELLQSHNHQLGAHWAHGESLRFATSLEVDGRFVIDVQELRPTSDPPLLVVESFPVPPQGGRFSFSPISFHASFVSKTEVIILNVRDSKVLFQTKVTQHLYTPPGHFSPDGHFLACRSSREEISIWENTTIGYVPWNPLRPQSPLKGFLFSPTAISILSWGPEGVQLLHLSNHVSPLPTSKIEPHHQGNKHLVASPTGGTHVTTTQQEGIARSAIVDPGWVCFYF
jgi:hypothetical protein